MADIAFIYNDTLQHSDLKIVNGDFLLCDNPTFNGSEFVEVSSLQVAVEISLFTDRRATAEEIRAFQLGQAGRQSRRGYWANEFKDFPQGSGLWLLSRAKRTNATLAKANSYCSTSLDWLIVNGVVASVNPSCEFVGENLVIQIEITKPDGQDENFKYQYSWDGLERL